MDIIQGSVVKSIAGHDKDLYFVVMKAENGYVFIANGKERKLETLKRKNIKHISATASTIELNELTNKKLRKLLRTFDEALNKITN